METENLIDNTTDEVLIEANENSGDPNQKGVKRVAQTPPEKDAKKAKISCDSSPQSVIELSNDSPEKCPVPGTPKTPKTPKVSKEEREKLRREKMEEKEKQRAERERIQEEKRLEKEKLAEEKRLEKEKKEKEKNEKKLEEEKKKEEKREAAEMRKKKEEEEKQKKEEEKMKKEEEKNKKKKEEEEKKEAKRKEEEAAEAKKRRESQRFVSFFAKVEKKKVTVESQSTSFYLPFELKDGMTVAPILARDPISADVDILEQKEDVTSIVSFIETAKKLKPMEQEEKDKLEMKVKIFQFHENRRPPYFGTWRKKSTIVKGWCPLAEEQDGVDYKVDSDDDWEDEPSDGEECNSDEDAGEKDNDEEDDEDDGFFVPPCYLSDGEGEEDTSDGEAGNQKLKKKMKRVTIDSDDEEGNPNESSNDAVERKARLEQRAQEWAKRTEKKKQLSIAPRAVGPIYVDEMMPNEFKFMAAVHFY